MSQIGNSSQLGEIWRIAWTMIQINPNLNFNATFCIHTLNLTTKPTRKLCCQCFVSYTQIEEPKIRKSGKSRYLICKLTGPRGEAIIPAYNQLCIGSRILGQNLKRKPPNPNPELESRSWFQIQIWRLSLPISESVRRHESLRES